MKLDNNTINRLIIATVALIVGFLFGSLWRENQLLKNGISGTRVDAPTQEAPTEVAGSLADMPEITDEDYVIGSLDAPVILVEYSDYECPFCNRFHPTMKQIVDEYGDQVAWVYRHFPLTNIHPRAQISAEAAECVGKIAGNDAFWQYSDRLFEEAGLSGADALTEDLLLQYATDLGVSTSAVQACLDSGETTELVNADTAGGRAAGITGTPGTVLITQEGDYELISGALPFEQITTVIDQYL